MAVDPSELLIFRQREANNASLQSLTQDNQPQDDASAQSDRDKSVLGTEKGDDNTATDANSQQQSSYVQFDVSHQLTKTELRAAARGKRCFWHPWRAAYSICAQCKRPFCYEDLIEYNAQNFCLEDASMGATEHKTTAEFQYRGTLGISGILFLCAFVVFLYFARDQALYLLNYLYSVGPVSFVVAAQSRYFLLLIELVLTALTIPSAFVILLKSEKSYYFSAVVGLATFVLFAYLFINSGTFYLLLVGLLSLGAVVVLMISKGAYASFIDVMDYWQPTQQSLKWENVGEF